MSNKDHKIKVARNTEQEYAHNYNKEDYQNYQYENEDKRVRYHVDSDGEDSMTREELYNVEPESVVSKPLNKIRARLDNNDILDDHKERAYKVRNVPPVWDKSDPGKEAYQLHNDVREDEVNYIKKSNEIFNQRIQEENSRDLSKPEDRFVVYEEPSSSNQTEESCNLFVGALVKHKEEGIKGEIKFIGSDKVAVAWEDKTRERFSIDEAKEVLAYVGDIEQLVDPTHSTQFPKTEESPEEEKVIAKETEELLSKALAALDEEINLDEDDFNHVDDIKKKAAMEIVDLMQSKGLLEKTKEAEETQIKQIIAMDDTQFEDFKNKIISNKFDAMDAALLDIDKDDDFSDIEDGHAYAKIKEQVLKASEKQSRTVDGIMMGDTAMFESGALKASDFKATVGDFTTQTAIASSNVSAPETRSIKRSDNVKTAAPKNQTSQFDFSGFQGLEGLTKPINIPDKEVTAKGKFSDVFGDSSFWTTITKIH